MNNYENITPNGMSEPIVGEDMSSATGRIFKKEPKANVISKEDFEERVQKVFHLLWSILSKSFGPYGAPTLINNYPYSHVTKDGYTIMKNLSMDASETLVDQIIADMAADICGRLNYSVGDGTTSAVIATNSIYQNYCDNKKWFKDNLVLPRDIIQKYSVIKETLIKKLQEKSRPITDADLNQTIHDVVYISSNGDNQITDYIAELYSELGCPAISCVLSPDGVTRKRLINGYKLGVTLTDKLYINSDDNTLKLNEADIVIFETKITRETYEMILQPLNNNSRARGRHLIVMAPYYDEMALKQVISRDLNNEYSKTKDINMILTTYKATSAHAKRVINDFAVLCNTIIIDRPIERAIKEDLSSDDHKQIFEIFNIDSRDIPGINNVAFRRVTNSEGKVVSDYNDPFMFTGINELHNGYEAPILIDNPIRLGYAKDISLGLESSVFGKFYYDQHRFDAVYKDAKDVLQTTENKYKKLGTFNYEVSQAQERFYSLNLKMGLIEVGADSELSQKLLKDAVDDAIKAAASAFNFGVINGCNVDMLICIEDTINNISNTTNDPIDMILLKILRGGFRDVYRTVLSSAIEDFEIELDNYETTNEFTRYLYTGIVEKVFPDFDKLIKMIDEDIDTYKVNFIDLIIDYSIKYGLVFDVASKKFTDRVINSCRTDEEILKATIDLISLLITGNQMIVTQKHNF